MFNHVYTEDLDRRTPLQQKYTLYRQHVFNKLCKSFMTDVVSTLRHIFIGFYSYVSITELIHVLINVGGYCNERVIRFLCRSEIF